MPVDSENNIRGISVWIEKSMWGGRRLNRHPGRHNKTVEGALADLKENHITMGLVEREGQPATLDHNTLLTADQKPIWLLTRYWLIKHGLMKK